MVGVALILPFLAVVADPIQNHATSIFRSWKALQVFRNLRIFLIFLGVLVFLFLMLIFGFKTLTLHSMARFSQMRVHTISTNEKNILISPMPWFSTDIAPTSGSRFCPMQHMVNAALIPAMRMLSQVISLLFLVGLLIFLEPIVCHHCCHSFGGAYTVIFHLVRRYLSRMGAVRLAQMKRAFK